MHRTRFMFGISVLVLVGGSVVSAQQGPTSTSSKPNAAKPTAATTAAKPATPAPHPATAGAAQAKTTTPTPPATMASGNKSQAKPATPPASVPKTATKSPAATPTTAKNNKASTTKVAKADVKTTKSEKPANTKVAKTEKKSDKPAKATTTTSAKTSTTTPTTLTPVQEKLKQNTNLAAKLQDRLPKGTDLMAAAAGFRNLGQFVAAVNVANNLNISFTELKTKMVTNNMSLGQAIQAVRPLTASPTVEAQRAEYDARGMISESEQTESTTPARTHGPVTTPTSSTTPTTSSTAKAKTKTTKTSAQ